MPCVCCLWTNGFETVTETWSTSAFSLCEGENRELPEERNEVTRFSLPCGQHSHALHLPRAPPPRVPLPVPSLPSHGKG